jgi:hypothetical protein
MSTVDNKVIFSMAGVSKTYPPQKQVLKDIYLSFFYISVGWPSSLFRPNNLKKKLTPNFADRFGQSGRPNSLPARPRES